MRPVLSALVLVLIILPARSDTFARTQTASAEDSQNVQVIEVTAKKYEFSPSVIRVKQGQRVRLKITATDRSHGFSIKEFPEGEGKSSNPGLIFSSPEDCRKIEINQTQTIEFVARTPGTYPFKCCVFCGLHHGSMKGELIVQP